MIGARHEAQARGACAALVAALERRDPLLHEHAREVAVLARALARELGLDSAERAAVARAGWLHDIGKLVIPEDILRKPGPLTGTEAERMRSHVVLGEEIIAAAPCLRDVALIVRASHERWDGAGYPDALSGEEIPLGARIVTICDAFSAMCQDRPYGRVLGPGDALNELERCAGRQFDARLVECFTAMHIPHPDLTVPVTVDGTHG